MYDDYVGGAYEAAGLDWDMAVLPGHGAISSSLDITDSTVPHPTSSASLISSLQFTHPLESSVKNLMAYDLDHPLAPNGCIDPALIQESSSVAALSASVASMTVAPQAELPPAAPIDAESPRAESIETELPPAEPIEAQPPPAEPIEAPSTICLSGF